MSDDNSVRIRNWVAALMVTVGIAFSGQAVIVITSVTELRTAYRHMQADVTDLKTELRSLIREGTQKRYTSEDATADKRTMVELIQSVNARVAVGERRLDMLEDRARQ